MLKSKFFLPMQLVLSNSREERRNLYLVLFDYALHQINESCIASGMSDYSDDEVQPVAVLLMLADAPEALHISVKLGLEGILELLQRPISSALSKYPNSDRLSMVMLTLFRACFHWPSDMIVRHVKTSEEVYPIVLLYDNW